MASNMLYFKKTLTKEMFLRRLFVRRGEVLVKAEQGGSLRNIDFFIIGMNA